MLRSTAQTMVEDAIRGEVQYITANRLGHRTLADTVVVLRATLNQAFVCYATCNRNHANNLIRHLGGLCIWYFDNQKEHINPVARANSNSYGRCLLTFDRCIQEAQYSLVRGGIGDTKSHLMDLMGAIYGCFSEFGIVEREGYESENSETD